MAKKPPRRIDRKEKIARRNAEKGEKDTDQKGSHSSTSNEGAREPVPFGGSALLRSYCC